MDIKATIDKESFGYRNRLLLIAAGALLYAAWCLYDGMIGYPDKIEAYDAISALKVEHPEDWRERWAEVAKENGWDHTKEPDEKSQGDIMTQWLQFAVVFPIGAYCLISVARWSRKYVGVDGETLYGNGKVEVPFDKITRIDATRWERKGIARVHYDIGSGDQNVLIDDFKYERQPANEVFKRVKDAVDTDLIEGLSMQADSVPDASESPAG